MRRLAALPLFFLVLLFSSCEDVVQVKLDQGAKLYVIDAFISEVPSQQLIRISTSDAYFSSSAPPPVEGAKVLVRDLTAGIDYEFAGLGNGVYGPAAKGDSLGKTGHQYELLVTIDSHTYRALTTQNRRASIEAIVPEYNDGSGGGFGPPGEAPHYMCNLLAKDRTDENPDYYLVKTYRNDSLLFSPTDINISIDGTNGVVSGVSADSTYFSPPITFLGFRRFYSGNTCRVEIHSITRDAYHFFRQAIAQVNNAGLFATTPENVKTNIVTPPGAPVKAVGWFNVAGVTGKEIIIP
jgi:hypothetical protein